MYAALWRAIPWPAWAKALLFVVAAAVVLAACVLWIFPWIDHTFLLQDGTVDQGGAQ